VNDSKLVQYVNLVTLSVILAESPVTLRHRGHIGWNSSKITSVQLDSVGCFALRRAQHH